MRDYAEVRESGHIGRDTADRALKMLEVDALGLDVMDRKLLKAVIADRIWPGLLRRPSSREGALRRTRERR